MPGYDFHSLEGLARSLDGVDDYFRRASEAAFQPGTSNFGVSAFAYLAGANLNVVGKWKTGGTVEWTLAVSGNELLFAVSNNGTAYCLAISTGAAVPSTSHVLLSGWYDVGSATAYCAVGTAAAIVGTGSAASVFAGTNDLTVGATHGGAGLYAGRVSKLGLWVGAYPSTAQRAQLWNSNAGLTREALPDALLDHLVCYHNGAEPSGDNLRDAYGTHDMTAVGTPGTAAGPDAAAAITVVHPLGPTLPVDRWTLGNVVSSSTPARRVRSQDRGNDQRCYATFWDLTTEAHLAAVQAWFAAYKGRRRPYYLELPDGTRLRVRCPQSKLPWPQPHNTWTTIGPIEHEEDIL
jgi:hypothetical protein